MTRAYIRLDPRFDERKSHYPDGAYAALVATFCLAETQPDRGRFRSPAFLKALLERRGRHVAYLMAQGDLEVLPDGRAYVVGWDEWQEGDVTVRERVQRIRSRRRGNGSGNGSGNAERNGPANASGNGSPLSNRFSRTYSGAEQSGASGRDGGLPAALSDDEQREHLDRLRDELAPGILPVAKSRPA